jgi:hypothetical protein
MSEGQPVHRRQQDNLFTCSDFKTTKCSVLARPFRDLEVGTGPIEQVLDFTEHFYWPTLSILCFNFLCVSHNNFSC